ncbi:membrane protein insertase YidC [Viridibacillus sp. YIM B01967]|uniref:Membrane protein insertase YidC n=1 Tax=Viridibacillus soli TaxID=2798301 RepID=A0ABS1H6R3_9BACL|nr:membrane protein insertase YidC [Viridibacillus soli]MBK3494718.1 membrane protein insertase YidC [Viridibacillus soli]
MKKYFGWSTYLLIALFVLTGCASNEKGAKDLGFFHEHFVIPFMDGIHFLAHHLNGSYGLAIVAITLIIRLLLLPLMLKNYKGQKMMQLKMAKVKPEMDALQKKANASTNQEEQMKYQQEIFSLYKKSDISIMNLGCLPLLIQMPILMALYLAIRGDQLIATQNFLWFNLGTPDLIMTLLAGALYFLQSQSSLKGMNGEQQKQMRIMGLLSPIMIMIFSFSSPSVLPLYWAVGALVLILQQFISHNYIKIPDK